jgi:hypothetical protein
VELDSPLGLAVAVQNGDVDAAISSANLAWVATENMLPGLRLAFPVPGSRFDLRYSIGKEHAPLLGIIDKALAAIEPAEMMRMLRKWGSEEQPNIAVSAAERAWLAQKHSVRVRIGDHPPWEINRPEAAGMAVDYLRIIAKCQAMVTRREWAPLISLIDKGLGAIPAEQHIAIRQRWLASVADGGVQAPLALSADERAWIAAHPTFRVGAYALPPFIEEQDGQAELFDGHPHAGARRPCGLSAHPRAAGRGAAAHYRAHRQRPGRRARALSGGRHGRLPAQAH